MRPQQGPLTRSVADRQMFSLAFKLRWQNDVIRKLLPIMLAFCLLCLISKKCQHDVRVPSQGGREPPPPPK